jgi:glycosyltransferase involved in cell wall biosynthesis
MIVRNESARIIRALDSVRPFITTFAILDTGSTDNTVELIRDWGIKHGINGIVGMGAFVNFSQARNQALDLGRSWVKRHRFEEPLTDYLLLMDADMELVVEDWEAFSGLSGEMFQMVQRAGSISYHNARLLAINSGAKYEGVTHEYLAAAPSGVVAKAFFVDHADGSNRADKFARDIRLLLADLERDSNNPRTWFYLANSYRDAGDHQKAIEAYRRRIEIGGWDEETWSARINLANELDKIGLEDSYIKEALGAIQERPQRAEAYYALAKHYREKGQHNIAVLFAEAGMSKLRPDDRLFIEDWVYEWGMREELSISGFFVPDLKERSFVVTNGLATDRRVPDDHRALARRNMVWHLQPLQALCPSALLQPLAPYEGVSPGFTAMNPCITNKPNGDLELLLRTVNYKINELGQYMIGEKGCQDVPIVTENHLLSLSRHLSITDGAKVGWERPEPKFPLVIGLEDMRIFWHKGERQFLACVREQSAGGVCDQWHGYLRWRFGNPENSRAEDAKLISNGTDYEKNWAPLLSGPDLKFVYRLDKIIEDGKMRKVERGFTCDNISGSSQWIRLRRGWVAVVHEAVIHPGTGKRVYQHRFAYTDNNFQHMRISLPFVFQQAQIEFCAGIADHPNGRDLVLSFGVRDEEAWLATVTSTDVANALRLS